VKKKEIFILTSTNTTHMDKKYIDNQEVIKIDCKPVENSGLSSLPLMLIRSVRVHDDSRVFLLHDYRREL